MRVLLILFPFFAAIGGLVFLQTGLFAPPAPTPATASAPAAAASGNGPAMPLSDVTQVVARLAADQPTGQVRPVPRPRIADEGQGSGTDSEAGAGGLQGLTMQVLAGLGMVSAPDTAAPAAAPAATGDQDEMRALTMAVLAGLSGSQPAGGAPAAASENLPLSELISRAVAQGTSDAYLDALINEAADSGQIDIPAALRSADGSVDTDTLLRALILANGGGALSGIPADIIPTGQGVEVRVVQEAGETRPYYFYTVQEGDSLGGIAQNFYGDAAYYKVIFEANRRLLSSPNRIKVGQRLRIPTRG